MTWVKTKERLPNAGTKVLCRLKHFHTGSIQEHRLVKTEEDDCDWRTAEDLCEISFSWDVMEWFEASKNEISEHVGI